MIDDVGCSLPCYGPVASGLAGHVDLLRGGYANTVDGKMNIPFSLSCSSPHGDVICRAVSDWLMRKSTHTGTLLRLFDVVSQTYIRVPPSCSCVLYSMAVDSRRRPLLNGAVALLLVSGIVVGFITPATHISSSSATCRRHRSHHDCTGAVSCRAQRQVDGDAKADVEAVGTAEATREESESHDEQSSGRWRWRRNNSRRQRVQVGEVAKKQLFTYDWDNGDRVVWSASKRSNVEVVSFHADIFVVDMLSLSLSSGFCSKGGLLYLRTWSIVPTSHDHVIIFEI